MSEMDLFEVRNLNVWYDQFHALKNINANIEAQTITALIGPSGCGKSTFIRCLNRLNDEIIGTKVKGEIFFHSQNILSRENDPVLTRRKIGMVFQQPNPFPMLSIFDNVAIGLKLLGMKKKQDLMNRVETCLRQAALWDEVKDNLDALGTSLSGGQQQRLCIARTIANGPEVILMDEPTSALDPIATEKIEQLMLELKKEYTIVVVTHNMQQAQRVSDQVCFFMLGELLEAGDTKNFFTNPQHTSAQAYISGSFG